MQSVYLIEETDSNKLLQARQSQGQGERGTHHNLTGTVFIDKIKVKLMSKKKKNVIFILYKLNFCNFYYLPIILADVKLIN